MKTLITLSRMWLTRSRKPFIFHNEYDQNLQYQDEQQLGIYVHIPFCKKICQFCPYCKEVYDLQKCNRYIDYLLQEIHLVGKKTINKKKVTSVYFGGGSPALAANRMKEIIDTLHQYFIITEGIGIELHPTDVNVKTLTILKEAGITKISIGIQSFSDKYLSVLGRKKFHQEEIKKVLETISFPTVSMDFIFALPKQTIEDIIFDIETAFTSGANHIAIYPFIDFSFTKSNVAILPKKEKRKCLDELTKYCQNKGYTRDSIWTYAKQDDAHYSSMTRTNFLGFGCSATTLLQNQFKINTFSIEEYQKRIDKEELPTALTIRFSKRQRMLYYLFWTLYSTMLDERDFEAFFHTPLKKVYRLEFWLAQRLGLVEKQGAIYTLTTKGAFYFHHYEHYYTLSYIDQMWHVMRNQAFPKKIEL